MKKLTKIKLINWHLFSNQTIEIKGNALISGENGSGKSTLLDAMQYLLVGGKSGVKFNIAATDDARRSLEGYVKGRIGAENKEFLRNGDVVTHVALEFYDEQSKMNSIVGCVIDLPKGGQLKDRFYLIDGISIHDPMFIDGKMPRDFKSMKTYFKTLDVEMDTYDSQKQYRDSLARFFGMDARKYAKILPKALAFRSIDLQAFVFEFLLDDDPIDIQSLKNNVAQLKKVETQIKTDKEKLEKLDTISNVGADLVADKDQITINILLDNLNWVEKREKFIKSSEEIIEKIDQKLDGLREEKAKIDRALDGNDKALINLESARNDSDSTRTLAKYQDDLVKKEEEYNHQKEIVSELKLTLTKECEYLKQIVELIPNAAMKSFLKYYLSNEDNINSNELQEHLRNIASESQAYLQAYQIEREKLETEKNELSQEIRETQIRLNQLKKNVKTYPRNVSELIRALNDGLSNHYQKEIRVSPFCELIEINDESWRNALEGYLSGQRFDLIVDPKYFNDALEIYDKVRVEYQIYGVGLVNTAKIKAYENVVDETLASKITTDHNYARYYANMLLNSVFCAKDLHDLKNYNRAITKSCMTYGNHTARQINPRTYEIPYIGQAANNIQIDQITTELEGLDNRMDQLYKLTDNNNKVTKLLGQTKSLQMVHQNNLRYLDVIKTTRREYTILEEQLENLSSNPNVAKFEQQIEKERQNRRQLRLDSERIVGEIATYREEKNKTIEMVDETKAKLEGFIEEQRTISQQHPEKLSIAQTQYYALKHHHSGDYDAVTNSIAQSNVQLKMGLAKFETELINLMKNYNSCFHFGANPVVESLVEFEHEANVIRNNNLVKYEAEATELRKSSETGFKEEFVSKLRASIENAQQQISELNMALTGKTFGSDAYQLVCHASSQPEFREYYEIIMGNDSVEKHTLFTEGLSKRSEDILMELFEKIASNDPEYDKIAYTYLDYRNYMSYDIEILNQNGNKSFFSKVSKEKSGGETQVPFYIVIAASFQQLLTRNKRIDSGCIVLFDEAFNNMDESRIDAMMKFYNSLSIQLLIAVPPQRVSNIINYVNTALVVVKDNDYAIIETFRDERMLAN